MLRFKGGTSLSKAYKQIERFSEDLDIILAKEHVLDEGEELFQPSNSKQKLFSEQLSQRTAQFISTILKEKIAAALGDAVKVCIDEEYSLLNAANKPRKIDNKNLHVVYPKVANDAYLRPDILLEIGIMSAWIPNESREILPYVAELNPQLGITPAIVPTIKAERTFWDKATILHREFYRPKTKHNKELGIDVPNHTPARYSRHYYDLYQMGHSSIKVAALSDTQLLADVVERKDKLYHSPWAEYELAKRRTIRLLPNENNRDLLAKDYQDMQGMIFGDKPDWEAILSYLQELEDEINKM